MPVPENFKPSDLDPPSQNLRAADYSLDQRWKLTISDVNVEEVKDRDDETQTRKKLVLSFKDREKRLMLNATNRGFLSARLGDSPNGWVGAEILLHRTTTQFGNDTVPALRIIDVRGGNVPEPDLEDEVPF